MASQPATKSFQKRPRVMQMAPEHLTTLQQLIFLQQHHQRILADLDNQAATLLLTEYGVDLQTNQWTINLVTGQLVRQPAPAQAPAS
jgi:hypothetical protein